VARLSARLDTSHFDAAFSDFYRFAEQRMERAALIATARGANEAKADVRAAMSSAGLGGLGNAIGDRSDLAAGRGVHRYAGGGFSASGELYIRSRSERTRGAIDSYTRGAEITPRGRWLWIPTDQIPRIGTGKKRLTPATWVASGMERRIGPLVFVRSINGNPLLVVKNASVALSGKTRSARALNKNGRAKKGMVERAFIVAFIGIPRTARTARVDVGQILRVTQGQLTNYFYEALGRI